ncbi:hypothetical protein PoHVEF18_001503 [Penicillium ochrochloron]
MSSFAISWTLTGDFAWLHVAWRILICALLLTPAYFLWSIWTPSVQSRSGIRATGDVGPGDSTSRAEDDTTSRTGNNISRHGDGDTSDAISSQETTRKPSCDDASILAANTPKSKLDRTDYTVGWICAISTEHVAALAFLDEEHEGPEDVADNDDNDYTLGRVGKHNVVIVVLPVGEYGIAAATSVAKDLSHSFPNVRIGLMVGIGGGAPSRKHDIRLGDIVVSAPGGGHSGVFQYDFGKTIQGGTFHTTGMLNQPPRFLRTAVNGLKTHYKSKGHNLEKAINGVLQRNPRLQEYERPQSSTDRLYQTEVAHPPNNEASCAMCCGNDPSKLISRRERTKYDDTPTIHYGLIASANQVMKDASIRDKLIAEKDVLCFEMEAAGLMNQFPCLVIRGICDYSDSHKNKEWQGYAAMAAAAYTRDLLYRIPPTKIETARRICDILSDLQQKLLQSLEAQQVAVQEQLELQKDEVQWKRSDEQNQCLQLFRLTKSDEDATYEWYKDRVEKRVEGTCQWFLKHAYFQEWLKKDSGPLLVSADPGCGKSVLAKYLIDHALPRSTTICYFFFKEHDQNTVRQALCALIHQLFSQKPSLIDHAVPRFRKDGQGLINSTRSLWAVLENAVKDPQAGPVVLVIDAIDECVEPDFENLVENVKSQFGSDQIGHSHLKCLLTSRPYEQVLSKFNYLLRAFPNIHIPGEKESEIISQEVNRVIRYRVDQLAEEKRLPGEIKRRLIARLLEISHRTYLWVYLVFDYLKVTGFTKTATGVDSAIGTLPKTVNDAYEQILKKSKEPPSARRALSIILAANRPLTLSEMNIAMNIQQTSQSIHKLDLEEGRDFEQSLRRWCGLFVSIHYGKIYFLHQTAREFLLADFGSPTPVPSGLQWHHSITARQAHTILATACVRYLEFFNSDVRLPPGANGETSNSIDIKAFLDYSAGTWGAHFREADIIDDDAIIPSALRICDPGSKSYSAWFRIYWETTFTSTPENFTDLMLTSHYGHRTVVKVLLEKGADVEARDSDADVEAEDSKYGRTPLSWAAERGRAAVVKLLLEKGADVEAKDSEYDRTPLSWAAERGHEAVVELLLENSADVEAEDSKYGRTPLSWAAERGRAAVVKLLLEKGADAEAKDSEYSRTILSWAAEGGHEAVVKLLLDQGADVEAKESGLGQTPLSWAAERGHAAVVKLLLEEGANVEAKDDIFSRTPLSWAAERGYAAVVKLLLEKGAIVEVNNSKYGLTPLSGAAEAGHEAVVELLLENSADVEAKDRKYGRTPLLWAAERGCVAVVKLLLEKGADVEAKESKYGRTPLLCAAERGRVAVAKLLLENSADVEAKESEYGRTPLLWAAERGHEAVVKLLLEKGADVEAKDSKYGRTPLSWAAERGRAAVVRLLLEKRADVEAKDSKYDRTPLSWAAERGHEAVVKLLLEKGADVKAKDSKYGFTPLLWAAEEGHEAVVELLLEEGADVEAKESEYGRTPLSWAAEEGNEAVVELLVEKKADVEAKDSKYGRTPLSWAAKEGHEAVVELLLGKGADVEAKESGLGQTPLLWAAERGHVTVVKLLLENGADVEAKDDVFSRTPLSWAAKEGHVAVVELLLKNSADVEARISEGQTPLSWAAERGYEAVVKLLLEKGADVEAKDSKYGRTPLSWAAKEGHEAVVKLLLEKGADVKAKDSEYGRTTLSWAAEGGHEAVVKLLLDNGADVEAKESGLGQTPLSWAAERGHAAVVKLLLEMGADLEAKDDVFSRTPLSWAAERGQAAVVELLLGNSADVEAKDCEYGRTPLSWAAEGGHEAVVKLLLEMGADFEAKDSKYNRTPLSWAAEEGEEAVVELLQRKSQ